MVTLAFAFAIAVQGQETTVRSKTKSKRGDVQTVTYTGCVQTGTKTSNYILANVVPVSQTTTTATTGTAGTTSETSTATTYELVPTRTVQIREQVGHKVEVTGVLIPERGGKSRTKEKIEHEHGGKVREQTTTKGTMPQFRVISIRSLGESCS